MTLFVGLCVPVSVVWVPVIDYGLELDPSSVERGLLNASHCWTMYINVGWEKIQLLPVPIECQVNLFGSSEENFFI